jgi:hypothetical protein
VKTITKFGMVFGLFAFLGLALAAQGSAEEFYTYRDPQGNLVISNKPPPPGSKVLKKQNLPEATDGQESPEGSDAQPNGRPEGSAKPSKKDAV